MKRLILALAAMSLPGAAAAQIVNISGTATPTVRNIDPGLVLTSTPGAFSLALDLNPATATPSALFVSNLFTLGTNESSVELDDLIDRPVSVLFSFTNPSGTGSDVITGQSDGFYTLLGSCGSLTGTGGCGRVIWGAPQTFNFAGGGSFSLALDDVTFGTPGTSSVGGTFRLIAAPVPEPGTWALMLLGFGVIGVSMRRRRVSAIAQMA